MVINQSELIKEIAKSEDINVTIVREVFRAAEDKIFAYLSSTTPSNDVKIKVFNGINITGEFTPGEVAKSGFFEGTKFRDRIKVRGRISDAYQKKFIFKE